MLACNTQTMHRGMFYSNQLIYCNRTNYSQLSSIISDLPAMLNAGAVQKTRNICVVSHFSTCSTVCTHMCSAHCTAPTCQTRLAICWRCVLTRDLTKHLYLCAPNVAKVIIATIITITDGPPASPLPLLFLDQTLRVQVLLEVQVREANC